LVRGNLSDYLDLLLIKSNTSRPEYRFNITRIYSNLGASPLKNISQICPIRKQNETCLRSSQVNIDCAGDERNHATSANITFVIDENSTFSLFVNFSSMPKYLDRSSNLSVVMMPNSDQKWLESVNDGSGTTYVVDYYSNSTFLFEDKFSVTIYSPSKLLENATGILVTGCLGKEAISIG